jgi:hypothetical protein
MSRDFEIDVSEIDKTIADEEIMEWAIDEIDEVVDNIYIDLVAPSPIGTPVYTGAARQSIQVDKSDPLHPELYSTSPYMQKLEDGSSKKTPGGYWQRAIDKATD